MQTVNWYMLNDLLSPIGGTADINEEVYKYQNFDSNSEMNVKEIISQEIQPHYDSRTKDYKESVKRSLSYFLTTNRINYGSLYDSCLIAFDHPIDARNFFLWIWEVLFPNEDYHIKDITNYQEIEDVNEPYIDLGSLSCP
jgi:hypothetical protein